MGGKKFGTVRSKKTTIISIGIFFALILGITIGLIVSLINTIENRQYEERVNYLSSIVTNSAYIVSEKISTEFQHADTLVQYLQNNEHSEDNCLDLVVNACNDLAFDEYILDVVDSVGFAYASDGTKSKVAQLEYYTLSSADSVMYISNGNSIDSNELYICLRERFDEPIVIGNTELLYCTVKIPYDDLCEISSVYYTEKANVIICDKSSGTFLFSNFEAGEMIAGTNIYSKYELGTYPHGEKYEDLIEQVKLGSTVITEMTDGKKDFFVCTASITDTPWLFCFVTLSDSLDINSSKYQARISFCLAGIIVCLCSAIAVIIIISVVRHGENRMYVAQKRMNDMVVDERNKLVTANKELEQTHEMLQAQQLQLEDALDMANAANRSKTTFLNNMSHDIRTPMNAIIGFTRLASLHMDDKEALESYLSKIKQSSGYLLSLINDVLDMSRIESGKIVIETEEENVQEIFTALHNIVTSEIHAKDLNFTMNLSDVKNRKVLCDKLRLNQILLNVVSNAIKYTPAGGNIYVTVSQEEKNEENISVYEIRVRDTGIGMTPEFAATVFEPFTRERSSTVSGIQGTGLGMAITKNLVDMMNGTIVCESEKGVGTEFIIRLPLHVCQDSEENGAEADGSKKDDVIEEKNYEGKVILLVEDNELNQEIALDILTEAGLKVETADNGQEACDKLLIRGAGYFDLVLMDIQMPVMDGYAATKCIRAFDNEDLAGIPIIAMTANAFAEDKKAATDAGMNGHLAKPIEIDKLFAMLDNFIK